MEFIPFRKIARLSRGCVVTEKIDGTNAQIRIDYCPKSNGAGERTDDGEGLCVYSEFRAEWYTLRAGSRTRWITPERDNYGFAAWAYAHAHELVDGLGEGSHFGEWWGQGIQRRYGLTEKRFSLFNVGRWVFYPPPPCCGVVPILYEGAWDEMDVAAILRRLREKGSVAAPGFMSPEGIVILHEASGTLFKKTLEGDESPKGLREGK